MLLIIIWYFGHNFWPRLGLDLIVLASASRFWPRLTSLNAGGVASRARGVWHEEGILPFNMVIANPYCAQRKLN